MENQINVGDQNTQQIGQNSTLSTPTGTGVQQVQDLTQSNPASGFSEPTVATNDVPKPKNFMKILLAILLVPALLIILLFIIVTPSVNKLSECLNEGNLAIERNVQTATAERWNREKVCTNGKPVTENLKACYLKAEEESSIPFGLVESLAKIIKPNVLTLEKAISMHNSACSNYPDLLITNP